MNGFGSLDTQDKTSDMTRFDLHREVSLGAGGALSNSRMGSESCPHVG